MIHAANVCGLVLWPLLQATPPGMGEPLPVSPGAPDRQGYQESVFALQLVLDRAGFAPGMLDGLWGAKTRRAIGMCRAGGRTLPAQAHDPYVQFTIGPDHVRQVGPLPRSWTGKSLVKWLPYPSLVELVVEKFHCSPGLLARLNPGLDVWHMGPGTTVVVPNVTVVGARQTADRIRVYLEHRTIVAEGGDGTALGAFPCSVAEDPRNRPVGTFRVTSVVPNPWFTFDPHVFREVRGIRGKLQIPPGPRSPVGIWWIGLSKRGYGIHGTPRPQDIGNTGSHGCFRMANWDVERLATMIRVGTRVIIERQFAPAIARASGQRVRR